jgi:hypothetical protein
MASDWVYHRDTGVAQVVERLPGRKLVVGNAAGRTTLERGYRYLDEQSIRVLAATDSAALVDLLRDDPAEVSRRMLLERDSIPVEEAVAFLREVGCSESDASAWATALPGALAGSRLSVNEGVLAHETETLSASTFLDLLVEMDRSEANGARSELERLLGGGSLPPMQTAAASAILNPGSSPASPAELLNNDPNVLEMIARTLTSPEGLGALVLGSARVKAARIAAARIAELELDLEGFLVLHFDQLLHGGGDSDSDGSAGPSSPEQSVGRLTLLGEELSEEVSVRVLRLAAKGRTSEGQRAVHRAIDKALTAVRLHSTGVSRVLRGDIAGVDASQAARVGATLPLESGGFRLAHAVAVSAAGAKEVLQELDFWAGISIAELAELSTSGDEEFAALLSSPDSRRGLSRRVDRELFSPSPDKVGALIGAPPVFVLADRDRVAAALHSMFSADEFSGILDRLVAPVVSEVSGRAEASRVEERDAAASREAGLNAESDRLRSEVELLRSRLEAAEALLRTDASLGNSATEAQTRQAWLDAARVAVDIVDEVRRFGAASDDGSTLAAVLGLLRAAGITDKGEENAVMRFDPAVFRRLDQDQSEMVTVVEPAYVTDRFGDVTIVRYGSVRGAEDD